MRTVKTASGATAVQIVWSSRRGARDIEYVGSAHGDKELEALHAAACQRLAGGQAEFDLGLGSAEMASATLEAINTALGNHPVVYAPKSALGHSIGAAGALASVLTVLTLRDQIIPPTLNLENQDPAIELDITSGRPRQLRIDYAINNSFGFGGHNVALTFGRR